MKRIGIMGGTFDPIHIGHLKVAEKAMETLQLDEVLIMPSGKPAYKMMKHSVSGKEYRAEMVQLAVSGHPGFSYSDLEMKREGNTYTSDTLTILRKEHPENRYYLIIGADSLVYMDEWHDPGTIFKLATIVVAGRDGVSEGELLKKTELFATEFHGNIIIIPFEHIPIASEEIRDKVEKGKSIKGLVPENVEAYIRENALYRD